eukprot:8283698-Pyramimonas_sp.AAC.2
MSIMVEHLLGVRHVRARSPSCSSPTPCPQDISTPRCPSCTRTQPKLRLAYTFTRVDYLRLR